MDSVVSSVPFSHLVASYQSVLRDPAKTLDIISRTEHSSAVKDEEQIILAEVKFIDSWLDNWAPEDIKFSLDNLANPSEFNDQEKEFLKALAEKIESAPKTTDGEWFHKAIYEFKDTTELEPKQLFGAIYKALIGKTSGPRAGWFLSILPRETLISSLRFQNKK